MATSILTQSVYNAPYGTDQTTSRGWLYGKLHFSAGTYPTGGIIPNLSAAGLLSPVLDDSGQVVEIGTLTQPTQIPISGVTVSGTAVTFTTPVPPPVNKPVTIQGFSLPTTVMLNSLTVTPVSVVAGVSFTVTLTTTATTTVDSAVAYTVVGPDDMDIHSVAGSGYTYMYNSNNNTVQIALAGVELTGGSTMPVGVTGDVIKYIASYVKA
jgi:hypothetical protein